MVHYLPTLLPLRRVQLATANLGLQRPKDTQTLLYRAQPLSFVAALDAVIVNDFNNGFRTELGLARLIYLDEDMLWSTRARAVPSCR